MPTAKPPIQDTFLTFHRDNPRIYELLCGYARKAQRARRKVGLKLVWERLRWELVVETYSSQEFRFNNNFPSRYARLIMQQEPDLRGFFDTRILKRA